MTKKTDYDWPNYSRVDFGRDSNGQMVVKAKDLFGLNTILASKTPEEIKEIMYGKWEFNEDEKKD